MTDAAHSTATLRRESVLVAIVALVVAVVLCGPVLGPGALFQLDRSLVPDVPLPPGTWGGGPEIPRDVPLSTLLWCVGALLGHIAVGKASMVLAIVGAAVGSYRLARRTTRPMLAATTALLYAASPFLLTRLAVGHQGIYIAMALLPWTVSALVDRRPRRVLAGVLVLGLAGSFGGIVAGLLVLASLRATDGLRRSVARVGALVVGCLPWLVPGLVVMLGAPSLVSSAYFPGGTRSPWEVLELAAGQGFWLPTFEVGLTNDLLLGAAGATLLVLGVIGAGRVAGDLRRPLERVSVLVAVLAIAPATFGLSSAFEAVTETPIGAPFREPQRFLVVYLLWMSLAAPAGAARLARRWPHRREAFLVLPIAVAVLLATPGAWGLGGYVTPAPIPAGWQEARAVIREGGGTTLLLPWNRYLALRFADASRAFNPLPKYLGTDVLLSSDLGIGGTSQERSDPREERADEAVAGILAGETAGVVPALRDLGVRWVLLIHEARYERYLPTLSQLPLIPTLIRPDVELFEVPGWRGEAVTDDGDVVDVPRIGAPVATLSEERAFTWYRGWQRGWMRGWDEVEQSSLGMFAVPAGTGPIWYWPMVPVVVADLTALAAAAWLAVDGARRRNGEGPE